MPPTREAARYTTSGRLSAIQAWVSVCWIRSTSVRSTVRILQSSVWSRRTRAEPTMPRWPATQARLPRMENTSFATAKALLGDGDEVVADHFGAQRLNGGFVLPAEPALGLSRITEQS